MPRQNCVRGIESAYLQSLLLILSVLTISGFATWWSSNFSVAVQWLIVLHALAGALGAWVFIPYVWLHFRRTLGLRRPAMMLSGLLLVVSLIVLTSTGLHLIVSGQSEAQAWILSVHIVVAISILLLLTAHTCLRLLYPPNQRTQISVHNCPALRSTVFKALMQGAVFSVVCEGIATAVYALGAEPYDDSAAIKPYQLPYGEHPFRPSQAETSSGGFFDAKRLGDSARCARCHGDIARQWQASIHAQAASDKAYQTNIRLLAERRGIEATRYCEGCHAPVALLSGQLSEGGQLETPGHLREGVSCMSCHGIERVENVQGVASYRMQASSPYLFEGGRQAWELWVHDLLIRLKPEAHKANLARPVLGSSELCATCHAQFMDQDFNGWGWVKMQDDYQSWLNGPYSGQYRQPFGHATPQRCQDCHFPLQPGNDPSANADGLVKSHFNLGANTAIPGLTHNQGQLQRTIEFLRADRLRISIDKPNRSDATESQRSMDTALKPSTEAPAYAYIGETLSIDVVVSNTQVGHAFPGGTTDINEAWLQFLVTDAQGMKIYESGYVDSANNVDANAHFYRTIPIDRAGHAVWRHDLFNMVGDSFKRVIPAGGSDVAHYTFTIPDDVKGFLHISARLQYRKLNNRYARWALQDDFLELPIVEMARVSVQIPLKIKPEVQGNRR